MSEHPDAAEIRDMKESDLDVVLETERSAREFDTGTGSPNFYGRETLREWLNSDRAVTLVVETGGNFVVYLLSSYQEGPGDACINHVFVREATKAAE